MSMAAARRLGLLFGLAALGSTLAAPPAFDYPALITEPRLDEISGLAASSQLADILWTHNDGDDDANLYAIDSHGRLRATVTIAGADNLDWEDLAAFTLEGRRYLLVADTGDNGGLRPELSLYVIEEPTELRDQTVPLAWRVRFRWPDGARDCEAVDVDSQRGEILLISKKRVPPELFRLPLLAGEQPVLEAERIGLLHGIEQPTETDLRRNPVYGRYRSQITGVSVSPDGGYLAVLNYRQLLLYRSDPAGWGQAVARPPVVLTYPWLPQAEAVTFSLDGRHLYIASERIPTPLLRLSVPLP